MVKGRRASSWILLKLNLWRMNIRIRSQQSLLVSNIVCFALLGLLLGLLFYQQVSSRGVASRAMDILECEYG
jgi:hypothetical protein